MRDCKKWCNVIQKSTTPNPFFIKLTLTNGDIVELEGEEELTQAMVSDLYNTTLVSAEIGELCTSIGSATFEGCTGLTSVTIPKFVISIDDSAFANCTNLTTITVEATTPPTLGDSVFDSTNNAPIYVPSESVETYKVASGWSDYASRIQAITN